jgi:hypothetical protein
VSGCVADAEMLPSLHEVERRPCLGSAGRLSGAHRALFTCAVLLAGAGDARELTVEQIGAVLA